MAFDGNNWSQNYVYEPDEGGVSFINVWGRSKNEVYAVGLLWRKVDNEQRGIILKYNGYVWDVFYKADYISQFNIILGTDKELFVSGVRIRNINEQIFLDSTYVKKIEGKSLKTIMASTTHAEIGPVLIGKKVYFIYSNQLYDWVGNNPKLVFDFSNYNFGQNVYGRSLKDLFIRMQDGIAHYNGTDIVYLYNFGKNVISMIGRPMDFGNTIFINVSTHSGNFNLRGSLNK